MQILTNLYNYDSSLDLFSVGMEQPWDSNIAPMGWMFKHGQFVMRKDFQRLFHWAEMNNLIVTDEDWLINKKYALFSYGDGETTFRLPDKRGFYDVGYEQGYHSGLSIYQQDQFQGHQHRFYMTYSPRAYIGGQGNGAVYCRPTMGDTNYETNDCINNGVHGNPRIGFRTQPRSLPRNYIIKY